MRYYSYDNELYAPCFPIDWAKNHLPNTGPVHCETCKDVGTWNGVFLGYCIPCADQYSGQRGNGFIFYGEEKMSSHTIKHSAMNTYLKDADWEKIGDPEIFDTAAFLRRINTYSPRPALDSDWKEVGAGPFINDCMIGWGGYDLLNDGYHSF